MVKDDKELLLKDISARVFYGLKICCVCWDSDSGTEFSTVETVTGIDSDFVYTIWDKTNEKCKHSLNQMNFKPFLRAMSSMTEDEKKEMYHDCYVVSIDFERKTTDMIAVPNSIRVVNWFLKKHFDIYGLIEKGLAIEVTEENNPC